MDGKIIVTTHYDTVWRAARIRVEHRSTGPLYRGNLDNLLPLSEIIHSVMPAIDDPLIRFYFTGGEEHTMEGARAVMKREGKALYIPIDTTPHAHRSDVNVEWPYRVNTAALKETLLRIPYVSVGFERGCPDETRVYGTRFPTFSLNLPVSGRIHGISTVSQKKVAHFGGTIVAILRAVRKNYDKICIFD